MKLLSDKSLMSGAHLSRQLIHFGYFRVMVCRAVGNEASG